MVTNPIYAGPVYESVNPQFRMVDSSHTTSSVAAGSNSEEGGVEVKDEEAVREEREVEELAMLEFDPASPEPPSSPRYLSFPKPHPPNSSLEQDMVEQPFPNPETLPTQNRQRNTLGLTLNLHASDGANGRVVNGRMVNGRSVSNGGSASRVLDLNLESGRQTRRRAATMSHTRPLLQSYFSSSSSTPGEDDHYTVMSPVGHLSTTTPTTLEDGRSFLRQDRRRNQDRSTTLI